MASDIVFGSVPPKRVPFALVALALLAAPAAALAVYALLPRSADAGIDVANNANVQSVRPTQGTRR